jgi:hypothetical protein
MFIVILSQVLVVVSAMALGAVIAILFMFIWGK